MSSPKSPQPPTSPLLELPLKEHAVVHRVADQQPNDRVAQRLRELGFVPGEPVRLLARGPIGGDPLLVQIGFTRFALRRAEAQRVEVQRK